MTASNSLAMLEPLASAHVSALFSKHASLLSEIRTALRAFKEASVLVTAALFGS